MSKDESLEILKKVVAEMRYLSERLANVENENSTLRKAVNDPETMMQKAGWLKITTPHASEAFDPLNRAEGDDMGVGLPFEGTGQVFQKSLSRYDELQEWIEAEEATKR